MFGWFVYARACTCLAVRKYLKGRVAGSILTCCVKRLTLEKNRWDACIALAPVDLPHPLCSPALLPAFPYSPARAVSAI